MTCKPHGSRTVNHTFSSVYEPVIAKPYELSGFTNGNLSSMDMPQGQKLLASRNSVHYAQPDLGHSCI